MKKVLFVIGSLDGGGAEKALLNLTKKLHKEKFDVTILSVHNKGIYIEEIKQYVKFKSFISLPNLKNTFLKKTLERILYRLFRYTPAHVLYQLAVREKFDVEIAFLEGISTKIVSGSINAESTKYAWVHTDLSTHPWSTQSYLNFRSEKKSYQVFKEVFCVSSAVQEAFQTKYCRSAKIQFNLIDKDLIVKQSNESIDDYVKTIPRIVSIGRLVPEKRFDRLLKVHKDLLEKGFVHELLIIGEGRERSKLQDIIDDNAMENSAFLLGHQPNPYKYLKDADIFVSSSDTEGLSTVVIESLILGIPVVATNCAGMKDLLGNSVYGIITEKNEQSLVDGILSLTKNAEKWNYYKKQAIKRGTDFDAIIQLKEFEKIIEGL